MKRYWPLFCLILVAALAAFALPWNSKAGWMHFFMGFFLCQFAMLKLFDLKGFSEGFQMYDLIASRIKLYGFIYPLIELALGLGFLSFFNPFLIYWVTIVVFGIGVIGVLLALRRGLDVRCACMGTALNVPLSTVTLTEDLAMILMTAFLLLQSSGLIE